MTGNRDRTKQTDAKGKPIGLTPGEESGDTIETEFAPESEPSSALGGGVATRSGTAETRDGKK